MSTTKMIQVRNVPPAVHRELVRRAKKRGETLTQYVEKLLEREVAQKTVDDVYAEVVKAGRVETPLAVAEIVRAAREERGAELDERIARALAEKQGKRKPR